MIHRGAAIAVLAVITGTSFTRTSFAARQQPTFRGSTDVVSIDVSVTSGRNPVAGLGAADFTLDDNGVRQTIDAVAMAALPIDVTFVTAVDITAAAGLQHMREAMERVHRELGPADRMSLIDYTDSVRVIVPLQTAAEIRPLDAPPSVIRDRSCGRIVTGGWAFGGASLNDAVFLALARPAEPGRRQMVVLFTDGVDSWSTIDSAQLIDLAARADAVIQFVMGAPKPDPNSATTKAGVTFTSSATVPSCVLTAGPPTKARLTRDLVSWNAIAKMTEQSGGQLHPMANLADTFAAIFDDFRSSYLLRYTLTGVPRAGWHDVTVKLTRPGSFTIRARKGYAG